VRRNNRAINQNQDKKKDQNQIKIKTDHKMNKRKRNKEEVVKPRNMILLTDVTISIPTIKF